MKARIGLVVAVLSAALLAIGMGGSGRAATPASGTINGSTSSVSWTGSFPVPGSPAPGCPLDADSTCDRFDLTVVSSGEKTVAVGVVPDDPRDELNLYVYRAGAHVASSTSASGEESVLFRHAGGTATYQVRVQPAIIGPTGSYRGAAELRTTAVPDVEIDCLESIPAAASTYPIVAGPTDGGAPIKLDVAVLIDTTISTGGGEITTSMPAARAAQVIADTKATYAPLNIDFRAVSQQTVAFPGDESGSLIAQAKSYFGGRRPVGADVVFVFTAQDIHSGGNYGVAGQADCIGGVRNGPNAFAVGEIYDTDGFRIGPLRFYELASAKIIGHEIGHLMGAHHHYGNCVEGATSLTRLAPGPCTLMSPLLDVLSPNFGSLEASVIRGHAVNWASP